MQSRYIKPDWGTQLRGFTLIELLVVIVVIAILVAIALPNLQKVKRKQMEAQTATQVNEIQKALEAFGTDHNGQYPFRVTWYDNATVSDPNFDPYVARDTGSGLTSDPGDRFSLGIWGGAERVTREGYNINTVQDIERPDLLPQPYAANWNYNNFYNRFNQYSDPLVAMGYIGEYPPNPFMKRQMGNVLWEYGDANWKNGGPARLDPSIPGENVVPTPGDFTYTHFYGVDSANDYTYPQGVVAGKAGYNVTYPSGAVQDGKYYIDVVDSYQIWGYGDMRLNGSWYVNYPNNSLGLAVRGNEAAGKDWNGNGTKDMFERGLVTYAKRSGQGSTTATDNSGNKVEF
ncbi:MAG: prepilin-type N-terminal cleavage/methylation domain-containing protein [Planctomycetales bacterium]|nr:prepilin-type N-terminal cleavage/methylation domain-containing protein [bacterium]UNM08926.1 MAG: prepilin-type N-terminal cleavage/methylation domain-containing protein [Planctomycetales bacterium]